MERNISIRKANEICNCNSCGARNYESSQPIYATNTPKVDVIYEVHIGTMCAGLCAACIDELTRHIAVVRGADLCRK